MKALTSFLLLASLTLTGCYKITYHNGNGGGAYPTSEQWHHGAIYGILEISKPVQLNQVCPSGFAKVHNEISLVNSVAMWVVGSVTATIGLPAGLWQPHTVSVWCNSGASYRLQVNEQNMVVAAEVLEGAEPTDLP